MVGSPRDGGVFWSCHFGVLLSVSSKLLSSERITTVFFTMACISLNRVCTRVMQDKLYQLLANKNQNTIYRQTRNFNNGTTGTTNLTTKRNHFHEIGFNSLARKLAGSLQVNISQTNTPQTNWQEKNKESLKRTNEKKKTNEKRRDFQRKIPHSDW